MPVDRVTSVNPAPPGAQSLFILAVHDGRSSQPLPSELTREVPIYSLDPQPFAPGQVIEVEGVRLMIVTAPGGTPLRRSVWVTGLSVMALAEVVYVIEAK